MPVRVGNPSPILPDGIPSKPGQLRPEYAVDASLQIALVPRDVIRQRRSPIVVKPFPERHGYRQTPLTIEDVLATDRWAPKQRQWLSGASGMPTPSFEPAAPEGGAGLRNFNEVMR